MKNAYAHMKECAAEAARGARGAAAAPASAATPCSGWDTRELINHWVLYTAHGLEHRALGTQLPDATTDRDFTADADWAESYAEQLDRAVAAWSDPAVWENEIDLGDSTSPARDVAAMLIMETALHGWDVARATGQEFGLSDAAAAFVLETVQGWAELYRSYGGFTDEAAVPGDASLFDRALAGSGRDPYRSAA